MSDAHLNVGLEPVDDTNPVPVKIVSGDVGGGATGGATEATLATRASAENQLTEIARLEAIRDRLPSSLAGGRLSVQVLGTFVQASAGASTGNVSAGSALNASSKMVSFMSEDAGTAFAFGTSAADAQIKAQAVATRIRVPAGASRDFAIPAGATHVAWIRTGTSDGYASVVELA